MNYRPKTDSYFSIAEVVTILAIAAIPLFITFPYRINIFLSWEGAYRIAEGQMPFRDFGLPMGYMYWVVPALFFKIFGPQLITLIKAQVFLNIVSGFAFRSILKSFGVHAGLRLAVVLMYCISFSFLNLWPWYNHTVVVYQMVSIAFLMYYLLRRDQWWWLALSALFTFFSFFTKQDAGALGFLLNLALLAFAALTDKKWKPLVIYTTTFFAVAAVFIIPLLPHRFDYWFNYGQSPHTARFSTLDVISEIFGQSQWIKFYFFLVLLSCLFLYKSGKDVLQQRNTSLFALLTLGILAEAALLQITSYTPPDGNIFFHSFAAAFLLFVVAKGATINFNRLRNATLLIVGVLVWWSGVFWRYIQRFAERALPVAATAPTTGENMVNRHTYVLRPAVAEIPVSDWGFSSLKSFENIYMPKGTIAGIDRLLRMEVAKKKGANILNMTELTPLAKEIPFELERGSHVPLWYHLGVGMFNKQAAMYEDRIRKKEYDLVLFEYIPTLNNFYPFRTRDVLLQHYQKIDSFPAPRRGDTPGFIEVYSK